MIKIKSLSEFLTVIDNLQIPDNDVSSTTLPWYRGQADSSWHLIPSIYRGDDWEPSSEREMVRDFQLRALMEVDHKPTTYLGWLFVMQHFGMPTRLLDWTESYLVALYFSVEQFENTCDATVWILHPWRLNEHPDSYDCKRVPPVNKEIDDLYLYHTEMIPEIDRSKRVLKKMPMALRPDHITRRIVAQRGQFTIHGHSQKGLDKIKGLELNRVDIDGNYKLSILRELYKAGICRYTVFPDIAGLAEEIKGRYSIKFMYNEL